jgi:hypothetical protein
MLSARERELYDMADEAYQTVQELMGTPDVEQAFGDGVCALTHVTLRCCDGDLDAYNETIEFYGSINGACNNV